MTTAASMGGLVRVSVGEGAPLSLYHQRSQQPQHNPLAQASLPPATKGWGGTSQQPLGFISTLLPVPQNGDLLWVNGRITKWQG